MTHSTASDSQTFWNDIAEELVYLFENPPKPEDRSAAILRFKKQILITKGWRGDRLYLTDSSVNQSERNSRIARAYQQGRHIAWLSRTEGISERQVLRVVTSLRAGRRPNSTG